MTDTIARRVVAHGRVQGVFFRDQTRREAVRRGIVGWVRNCADGTVEAHFEGSTEGVAAMVRWCQEGPRHADVSDLRVSETEPEGLDGFSIR